MMENIPLDQKEPSNTEPTLPAQVPSSLKPLSETWQQENPELMFLLGLGLGLLTILLAQAITLPTNGGFPGCMIPLLGLSIAVPLIASKPQRFLGVGLLVGLAFAVPISAVLWFDLICPPGSGGGC